MKSRLSCLLVFLLTLLLVGADVKSAYAAYTPPPPGLCYNVDLSHSSYVRDWGPANSVEISWFLDSFEYHKKYLELDPSTPYPDLEVTLPGGVIKVPYSDGAYNAIVSLPYPGATVTAKPLVYKDGEQVPTCRHRLEVKLNERQGGYPGDKLSKWVTTENPPEAPSGLYFSKGEPIEGRIPLTISAIAPPEIYKLVVKVDDQIAGVMFPRSQDGTFSLSLPDDPVDSKIAVAGCYSHCAAPSPESFILGPEMARVWNPSMPSEDDLHASVPLPIFQVVDDSLSISLNKYFGRSSSHEIEWADNPSFANSKTQIMKYYHRPLSLSGNKIKLPQSETGRLYIRIRMSALNNSNQYNSLWVGAAFIVSPGVLKNYIAYGGYSEGSISGVLLEGKADPSYPLVAQPQFLSYQDITTGGPVVTKSVTPDIFPGDVERGNWRVFVPGDDLIEGHTYKFGIQPYGKNTPINYVTSTIGSKSPIAPVDVQASSTDNGESLNVSWRNVRNAQEYKVLIDGEEKATVSPKLTDERAAAKVSGLEPGKIYSVSVIAVNPAGSSEPTPAVEAIATDLPVDAAAPAAPAPTVTSEQKITTDGAAQTVVTVTWPPVPGALGYDVYLDDKRVTCVSETTTTCTVTLAGNEPSHEVRVGVKYQETSSPVSPPATVTPTPIPGPVIRDVNNAPPASNGSAPTKVAPCPNGCGPTKDVPLVEKEFAFQWLPIPYADHYQIIIDGTEVATVPADQVHYRTMVPNGSNSTLEVRAVLQKFDGPLMAVLGDSYSSGEGAMVYDVVGDGIKDSGGYCHRSSKSWGWLTAQSGLVRDGENINTTPIFLACSGARTKNLVEWTEGELNPSDPSASSGVFQNGHSPQIAVLKALVEAGNDVRVVALTIGGNDVGFAAVGTNCIAFSFDCEPTSVTATTIGGKAVTSGEVMEEQLVSKLTNTLKQIKRAAPTADTYIGGYPVELSGTREDGSRPPELDTSNPTYTGGAGDYLWGSDYMKHNVCELSVGINMSARELFAKPEYVLQENLSLLNATERKRLNNFVVTLNSKVKEAALANGAVYVDHSFGGNDYCGEYMPGEEENFLQGLTLLTPQNQPNDSFITQFLRTFSSQNTASTAEGTGFLNVQAPESLHPTQAGFADWSTSWIEAIETQKPATPQPVTPVKNSRVEIVGLNECVGFENTQPFVCAPGVGLTVGTDQLPSTLYLSSKTITGFNPQTPIQVDLATPAGLTTHMETTLQTDPEGKATLPELTLPRMNPGTYQLSFKGGKMGSTNNEVTLSQNLNIRVNSGTAANLVTSSTEDGKIKVDWEGEADEWVVYYGDNLETLKHATTTTNTITLEDLKFGGEYELIVLPVNNGVTGTLSETVNQRAKGQAPSKITGVSVSVPDDGKATAKITFPKPNPGTSPITSYTTTVNPGGKEYTTSTNTVNTSGYTPGGTYEVSVKANSIDGSSAPSDTVTFTVPDWKPVNVEVKQDADKPKTGAILTWSNPQTFALSFIIEQANNPDFTDATVVNATPVKGNDGTWRLNVSGLDAGGQYWWRIKAKSSAGVETAWGQTVSLTTETFQAPGNLTVTNQDMPAVEGNPEMLLSWDAQKEVTTWVLQVSDDENFENVLGEVETGDTQYVLDEIDGDPLKSGVTYFVRVKPEQGNSSSWGVVSEKTLYFMESFYARPSDDDPRTTVTLEWGFWEQPATSYQVQYSTTNDFASPQEVTLDNPTSERAIVEQLEPGQTIWLRTRALQDGLPVTSWQTVKATTLLTATTYIQAMPSLEDPNQLILNWPSTSTGTWEIQYSTRENFSNATTLTIAGTEKQTTITDSAQAWTEQEIYFRIKASYPDNTESEWAQNYYRTDARNPDTYDTTAGNNPQETLKVRWNQPPETTRVKITYQANTESSIKHTVYTQPGETYKMLRGLTANTEYKITIQWLNSSGPGKHKVELTGKTAPVS